MTVDGAAGAGPTNAAAGASASATTRACAFASVAAMAFLRFLFVRAGARGDGVRFGHFSSFEPARPTRCERSLSLLPCIFAVREASVSWLEATIPFRRAQPPSVAKIGLEQHGCKKREYRADLRAPSGMTAVRITNAPRSRVGLQRDAVDCVHFCL